MDENLVEDIKFNCDLSDARYWGYFSICGLLMRYRDLYRSEQGLDPWSPIERQAIASWIEDKESRWSELEGQSFRALSVGPDRYPPFEVSAINEVLLPRGYVYGAGYGMYLKPTFFLARSRSAAEVDGHRVYTVGHELVRDLFTAPAMLQERSIFLRQEPLRILLWDRYSALKPGCSPALHEAFQAYDIAPGLPPSDDLSGKLDRMVEAGTDILLLHELAESFEALPGWKDVLTLAEDRLAELFLRALQDLVADTSDRGPLKAIIDRRDEGGLGLLNGLMEGYRRSLFPELRDAYRAFLDVRDWTVIESARKEGGARFRQIRGNVAELAANGNRETFGRSLRDIIRAAG